jgi:hypothetical protein
MIIWLILPAGTSSDPLRAASAFRDFSPPGLSTTVSTGKTPELSPEEINRAISFALHLSYQHERVVDSVEISKEIGRYAVPYCRLSAYHVHPFSESSAINKIIFEE